MKFKCQIHSYLLHILDDDACQSYEESPDEETPLCVPLSAPFTDLPAYPEGLAPGVAEEMTTCLPLST